MVKQLATKKSPHRRKTIYLVCSGLVLLGVIAAFVIYRKPPPKKVIPVTAGQNTKGEPTKPTANNTAQKDTSTPVPSTPTSPQTSKDSPSVSTAILSAPSGDFVSNHHPNLSGSPAPNRISSVCTTTPGASCTISFTKNGVTKSLPAQTTDAGGSTYWDWKLQDIDLSVGNWQVVATATLNSQTKTVNDPLLLEVAQ